jgi:penicillin-binding protein 2
MVSLPAYDNNAFSGGVSSTVYRALSTDENQPLFNRAIAGIYTSGSTVKIVVSTAALMEKVVTDSTTILSTGGVRLGQWFFPDWKAGGHGTANVRSAIAWSINTFFYLVGGGGQQGITGMGPEALSSWMKKFGLGAKTGIDIPGESAGFVPTPTWKQESRKESWYIGDTYNLSIGQGDLLVTPLQVARYTAAIANGGKLVLPRLVEDAPVQIGEQLADPAMIQTVQLGMRDAVTYGSARSLSTLPFSSGAKTGTAQWSKTKNTHAWFTSFAPFESPEIVVTVLIDEGGEGSGVAAPVAKRFLQGWNALRGTASTTNPVLKKSY